MPVSVTAYTPFTWNAYVQTWDAGDSGLLTWNTAQVSVAALTADETVHLVDAYANGIIKLFAESLSIYDTYVRRGPAVLANLVLRSDQLTFEQFLAEDHTSAGNGYGPFKPFIPGDYDLSKAIIKISLQREATSQDLRVTGGKFNADRPILTDSGTVTTVNSGTVSVTFAKSFLIAPNVSSTFTSSSGVAVPRVSNVTKTGFDIDLVDTSGTRVVGVVGWVAQGH